MNRQRLQHLRDILTDVPRERFDLSTWECGTTACAVGHACVDPEFMKEGLHFTGLYGYYTANIGTPAYLADMGWPAVEKFFELSEFTAEHLFCNAAYHKEGRVGNVGPLEVVARIDKLLEEGDYDTSQAS